MVCLACETADDPDFIDGGHHRRPGVRMAGTGSRVWKAFVPSHLVIGGGGLVRRQPDSQTKGNSRLANGSSPSCDGRGTCYLAYHCLCYALAA